MEGRKLLITSRSGPNGHGKAAVVILSEVLKRNAYLPQIINAPDALGTRFALADTGQQERRQDSNDGYDTKQFDQGKGSGAAPDTNGFHNLRSVQH